MLVLQNLVCLFWTYLFKKTLTLQRKCQKFTKQYALIYWECKFISYTQFKKENPNIDHRKILVGACIGETIFHVSYYFVSVKCHIPYALTKFRNKTQSTASSCSRYMKFNTFISCPPIHFLNIFGFINQYRYLLIYTVCRFFSKLSNTLYIGWKILIIVWKTC